MNPQCARCGKIVYPTEKVSCLDKVSGQTAVSSPGSLFAFHPDRGRAEAAGGELGGGAGGCKDQRGK